MDLPGVDPQQRFKGQTLQEWGDLLQVTPEIVWESAFGQGNIMFLRTRLVARLQGNRLDPEGIDKRQRARQKHIANRLPIDDLPLLSVSTRSGYAVLEEGNHRLWAFVQLRRRWFPVRLTLNLWQDEPAPAEEWRLKRFDRGYLRFRMADRKKLPLKTSGFGSYTPNTGNAKLLRDVYRVAVLDWSAPPDEFSDSELARVRLVEAVGIDCKICRTPASYVCDTCSSAYYCGRECQKEDWLAHRSVCIATRHDDLDSHMLVSAVAFDDRMRKKWRPLLEKLAALENRDKGTVVKRYDDLVVLFLTEKGKAKHTTRLRLKAMETWVSNKPDDIWAYEEETIRAMAEVFQLAIEDSLNPSGKTKIKAADMKFILDKILPLVLVTLKKACESSAKFKEVPFCPNVTKLRADLAKAKKRPTAPVKLPKPRKALDLNDLWDEKCSGVNAPWYGNAFHLMGAGLQIGEFLCKLALVPMSDAELDLMIMVLETLNQTPGKGILSAILPSDIQSMLDRRRRKEVLGLVEFESIFSKLMKIPGGMAFINSSKGMKSFGISTAEVKDAPRPSEQLPRTLDLNHWIRFNCAEADIEKSAICLMQKGYKVGEFLCRLRLIPLQDVESDLLLSIVNGTQTYADSLGFVSPTKAGLNLVLGKGNYAKRRLREAQPPLDSFQDIASLFEKLKFFSVLWLVAAQLTPYGLKS